MSLPRYSAYKPSGVQWLREVPIHWSVVQGRRLFDQKREAAHFNDEQLSATQKYGVIPQQMFMKLEDQMVTLALGGLDNFRHVEKNDFVISLRSFQGGIERSLYSGCVSPAYTVLRANQPIDGRFWAYVLKCSEYIAAIQSVTDGIREGKNISYDQFGQIGLPQPTVLEQTAIANFLDRETDKIDALVAEQEKLIALLKEKHHAVISHAVTKGLDTNVSMKDSGVEWLGKVPAHWEVCRMATLFKEVSRPGDPSMPILSISINNGITDDELAPEDRERQINQIEDRTKYKRVKPNDLAYNMMRAWQGAFGAVKVDGLVSPAYVVVEPIREFRTEYIEHLLRSPMAIEEMRRYSKGITDFRMRLYWEHCRDLRVCLPPLEEQDAILDLISSETKRIVLLSEMVQTSIALLKERRTALISAAVTGKIDVRQLVQEEVTV